MSLHKAPLSIQRLYDRGVKSVIPLFDGKNPAFGGWNKITDEEAQERIWDWRDGHRGKTENYGIRLGPRFGGQVDIDLDSEESRKLAPYYLPATLRFGRGGNVTHYLYNCVGLKGDLAAVKKLQWDKRDEKTVVLEFRGDGQTMGPGSVHPDTGEVIEWMCDDGVKLAEVAADELWQNVRELAAASLLLRDWNGAGVRDDLATCIVGSMLRAGWEEEEIDRWMQGILIEAEDEESGKRLKAERLRAGLEEGSGARIPGLGRLRELCLAGGIGLRGFESLIEWLELGKGDVVEDINKRYAKMKVAGQLVVLDESGEGGIELMSADGFHGWMAGRKIEVGGRMMESSKFWWEHPDCRKYNNGLVFKPGLDARDGEYNLWKGFGVEEVEGTWGVGWELYLEHLEQRVCGGDKRVYKWLLGWLAQRVQRPWELPRSAVVLKGDRGSGKGAIFKVFGKLFGRHFQHVTNIRHLLGNFNGHLKECAFLLADEVVWGGDKKHEGVLQTMITEPTRICEDKGVRAYSMSNCMGLAMCTNNDWAVPVGRMERRFLVLDVENGVRGAGAWWDKFWEQMGSEFALGRMLWDLRRWDLTGWRGDQPPVTDALRDQQDRGMEPWYMFMEEWLDGRGEEVEVWFEDLYDAYLAWSGVHRRVAEPMKTFGKHIRGMFELGVGCGVRADRGGVRRVRRGAVKRDLYLLYGVSETLARMRG